MKKSKNLKVILILLICVLLSIISFFGIYLKKNNNIINIVKDFMFSKEISKTTIITFNPTESEEQAITNYKGDKEKINDRLKIMQVEDFNIRLKEETGTMTVELPKEVSSSVLTNLMAVGEFEVIDSASSETILNNSDIKNVQVSNKETNYYGQIIEYISIEINLNKQGIEKINNINYEEKYDEAGNIIEQNIALSVDGVSLFTQSKLEFLTTVKKGTIGLSMGTGQETQEELKIYYEEAKCLEAIIENGPLQSNYQEVYSNLVISNINTSYFIIIGIILLIAMVTYLIIKYKINGLTHSITLIGFIAIYLLLIRYTNAIMSVAGFSAIAIITIIQFIFINKALKKNIKNMGEFNKEILDFINIMLPIFAISILFCFISNVVINSFGTILFWGIILIIAFSYAITKTLIIKEKR